MISRLFQSLSSQQRIAGGALVLALTQFASSFAGLIRERVLAATFPPGIDQLDVVSVYIAAFRPSDLLFQMIIMSAFSVALVPLLAGHLAHHRQEEMNRLLSSVLVLSGIVFGVIALLLGIFFDRLAPLFVQFDGERLALYVQFGRLACFTNVLFVIGNAFGQYLMTKQTYWIYGLTPIVYTAGTIVGALMLTDAFGPLGPMIGTITGAVAYVIIRCIAAIRGGYRWSYRYLLHPDIIEMGWLMLPRMAALGALQVQLLLFDRIASGLPLASVTINAYARNFQSAAVGIVGVALAQSSYSLLSQAHARGDHVRFRDTLQKGGMMCLGLTVPGAVVLALIASLCARIVHLTEPGVVSAFVITLWIYCLSIPFESLNHLLYRASYARKNTGFPAAFSVVGGMIAIAVAWIFAPSYGVYALPAGFVLGQVIQVAGLSIFLRYRSFASGGSSGSREELNP